MLSRQRGLSLVELMIGLLVGAVALAAVLTLYQTVATHTRRQLELAHLHALLQHILLLIESDARRSGYWHFRPGIDRLGDNPFQSAENDLRTGAYPGEPADSCLLLAYDADDDGKVGIGACASVDCPIWSDTDNVEQLGFRLKEGALQMRYAGDAFSCDAGRWQALTEAGITVTRFTARVVSDCLNLNAPDRPCGAASDQVWTRTLTVELEVQWTDRPETRLTSQRLVRVRNDRMVARKAT